MAKQKVLVQQADYNGYKNVLFMMEADDFRLVQSWPGYTIIAPAVYTHKTRTLTAAGKTYKVFQDWSLKEDKSFTVEQ